MGLLDLFRKGLKKTRDAVMGGLRTILPIGKPIDDALLEQLEEGLIASDMGPGAVAGLIDEVRQAWKQKSIRQSEEIIPFLKQRIASTWSAADRSIRRAAEGPTVIFVVGINGSGKTTSVAKLANVLRRQGGSVILAACDTFRAAAVNQLTIWAERIGVSIVKHNMGSDPAAVAFDACDAAVARRVDYLIVDTAGRLHTQDHLMRELEKIRNVVRKRLPGAPHEVLLVLDATIGQNAINQAKIFTRHVDVTGLFLAKLDGSAKGGIVVGIREQLDIPVKFVGLGETIDDVEPFDPQAFVEALFAEE